MQPTRRHILYAATGGLLAAAIRPAGAETSTDPRMADRGVGPADAKVSVQEWFSFTCPHCARFAQDVFPLIQAQLCDTGKLRYIFKEYPRDQVDLMAAMVARSLPPDRYVPFVMSLLATQMRWAFDRSVDPKEELAKQAALAGMPREYFDKVVADTKLKDEILAAQAQAEKSYDIEATPTFVSNGRSHSGEMTFDEFTKWLGLSA
jgi:protein-disulfide isomerase